MNKELEKKFDEKFPYDTLVSAHQSWTYDAIKSFIDENYIAKEEVCQKCMGHGWLNKPMKEAILRDQRDESIEDMTVGIKCKKCKGTGKLGNLYTKQQVEEVIGKDEPLPGPSRKAGHNYILIRNRLRTEIIERLHAQ